MSLFIILELLRISSLNFFFTWFSFLNNIIYSKFSYTLYKSKKRCKKYNFRPHSTVTCFFDLSY
uniref:Uncharacterized protein n=1 Tax=Amorphochlora amoebiformis TaxID=1561963 RepID=A0A0H5BLY8_9EUKA|nr:hypothetical protein [Amorphochlora amoebiformis]